MSKFFWRVLVIAVILVVFLVSAMSTQAGFRSPSLGVIVPLGLFVLLAAGILSLVAMGIYRITGGLGVTRLSIVAGLLWLLESILVIFVIPQFTRVFVELNIQIPFHTRFLMSGRGWPVGIICLLVALFSFSNDRYVPASVRKRVDAVTFLLALISIFLSLMAVALVNVGGLSNLQP